MSAVPSVVKELSIVKKKWRRIGEELGVGKYTLDNIHANYSEPENCLREVLSERVRSQTTTWGDIVAVLRTPGVRQSQLAAQLEAKYCPSELANQQCRTLKIVCQYTVCMNELYCNMLAEMLV